MLNVTPQRSSEGAKSYFAKSDYYSEGQELVGNWGGKGAVLLGLFGEVNKHAFDRLCDNLHPKTGEALTPVTRENRRVGYDFTWSAPKSVSVVHALTGDERIVRAFRESVHETMSEMEAEMQARVRKGRADDDRTTGNMAWAEFVHLTSRPVDGLPCPQLHSHCFAFNATYDVTEGTWKAGQFGKIKGDGYYWQAVQQARFAGALQSLGYGVRKTKDAFEITGVPENVLKKFSLRTMQIEKVAQALGITDPKAKAKLGATTREAKLDSIPYPQLVSKWDKLLTPDERVALYGSAGASRLVGDRSNEHVKFAADHAFERSSVLDERRLMTLALRHGIGSVTPEGVRSGLEKLGVLRREEHGHTLVTTPEVLKEERKMLAFAVEGKANCRPIASALPEQWQRELRDTRLSGEQRAAVEHVLSSPDRVMIVRGVAGAGKTTLTTEAVQRIEQAGKPVVMLAPSANASRGVLRAEGFEGADTLARFLLDEKMQASARGGVIWLDEAGLVGTKTLVKLFSLAGELDARVVLAGDKRQLGSVERGAPLRTLEEVAGLKIAEVTDIRRQSGEYKEAVKLLAAGKADGALEKLDAMGWVHALPSAEGYEQVARDYVDKLGTCGARESGVLIVCPTHAEGDRITAEVRRQMRDSGLLRGEEHHFQRLVPLQWTEAERGDRESYSGDEVLQFHRNSGGFKAGERVFAGAVLASSQPPSAASFSAYRATDISLAAGDIVRVTANGKTKDGRHKLNNGAVYTVAGFTPAGDITLSNAWVVDKSFGHLAHGVVTTAHAAQGRTVDHVIVCQGAESYPASSREGFYVAVSRGRKSATIYTEDKGDLMDAVKRSDVRVSGTELAARPRVQWWHRMRDRIVRMRLDALVAEKSQRQFERVQKEYAHAR